MPGTAQDCRPPVEVAVGVVIRPDGRVLLGQRPAGKPYAGWWEFPGGKLEAGESVAQALSRELHEELGLTPRQSHPWVVREFIYPHAHVRLHFHRVFEFDGEPRSREGQAFDWQLPDRITAAPLLPATVPVIGWLRLPARCAFSGAGVMGMDAFVEALGRDCSLRLLLLHEPALGPAEFEKLFHRVAELCRAAGTLLLVSSRHGESFGHAADGVLLCGQALYRALHRPRGRLAMAWCVDGAELAKAQSLGLDAAVMDQAPAVPVGLPVYMTADLRAPITGSVLPAGAHGLAARAGYWADPRPKDAGG